MEALMLTGVLHDGQGRVVAERNSPDVETGAAGRGSCGGDGSCAISVDSASSMKP
jgi:hypothetical protein